MFKILLLFIFFSKLCLAEIWEPWVTEWPNTDFTTHNINYSEIISGGPPKDGIPAIDKPKFDYVRNSKLDDLTPVISVFLKGEARAYPIEILIYHEIVNDKIKDIPIAVTYCPLCNSSIVFERKLDDLVLDFGTTGKLRNSDMIMYDRQTESWWQQFLGEAIVGELAGKKLKQIPARIESFALYKKRFPKGKVLIANKLLTRRYGSNPYVGYDTSNWPFLYKGDFTENISPLAYVVMVGKEAWALEMVRERRKIIHGDLEITWQKGQASALNNSKIAKGRDIGNVVVTRNGKPVNYMLPFAFAFKAFHPDGVIYSE